MMLLVGVGRSPVNDTRGVDVVLAEGAEEWVTGEVAVVAGGSG